MKAITEPESGARPAKQIASLGTRLKECPINSMILQVGQVHKLRKRIWQIRQKA